MAAGHNINVPSHFSSQCTRGIPPAQRCFGCDLNRSFNLFSNLFCYIFPKVHFPFHIVVNLPVLHAHKCPRLKRPLNQTLHHRSCSYFAPHYRIDTLHLGEEFGNGTREKKHSRPPYTSHSSQVGFTSIGIGRNKKKPSCSHQGPVGRFISFQCSKAYSLPSHVFPGRVSVTTCLVQAGWCFAILIFV